MQPHGKPKKAVCKWREKLTAGAQAQRGASGDRPFFWQCAEAASLRRQGWKPNGRDAKAARFTTARPDAHLTTLN